MTHSEQQAATTKARAFCQKIGVDYDKALYGYNKDGAEFEVGQSDDCIRLQVSTSKIYSAAGLYVMMVEFKPKLTTFMADGSRSSEKSFVSDLKKAA